MSRSSLMWVVNWFGLMPRVRSVSGERKRREERVGSVAASKIVRWQSGRRLRRVVQDACRSSSSLLVDWLVSMRTVYSVAWSIALRDLGCEDAVF